MAMTMQGEVVLPADRARVWAALNDPEVLKTCIPGCECSRRSSDTEFKAVAKVAIGPVKATFKGAVQLSDLDPPNGYTISGEGQGGIAGFAKGGAKVRLEEVPRARGSPTTSTRRSAARSPSSAGGSSTGSRRSMPTSSSPISRRCSRRRENAA